jgi:hypothetical protein
MTILLDFKKKMDNFFVNIIILHVLNYFQLLYDFFINLNYFTLHCLRLFMVIFKKIVIFGYFLLL